MPGQPLYPVIDGSASASPPPVQTTPPPPDHGNNPTELIAVLCIAGVVVAGILIVVVIDCLKKWRRATQTQRPAADSQPPPHGTLCSHEERDRDEITPINERDQREIVLAVPGGEDSTQGLEAARTSVQDGDRDEITPINERDQREIVLAFPGGEDSTQGLEAARTSVQEGDRDEITPISERDQREIVLEVPCGEDSTQGLEAARTGVQEGDRDEITPISERDQCEIVLEVPCGEDSTQGLEAERTGVQEGDRDEITPISERDQCQVVLEVPCGEDSTQGLEAARTSVQEGDRDEITPISERDQCQVVLEVPCGEDSTQGLEAARTSVQVIKNCDLEELQELGSGTFGTVYLGRWRGTYVAIKRMNSCFAGEQASKRDEFWNEVDRLASLHHPNIVAFYGVVLDGPAGTIATVTEYISNGSLRQALQVNRKMFDKGKKLLVAMDIAISMEYLHEKRIVHFDLKSDNLLLDQRDPRRLVCKVCDLGLSKARLRTLVSGGVRGTLPWMAPELLDGTPVSEKVDVYSFGIVMWEILTGEEPYKDLWEGAILGGIANNTLRPNVPESCEPWWRALMEQCWSNDPSDRPDFTQIASRLRAVASCSAKA